MVGGWNQHVERKMRLFISYDAVDFRKDWGALSTERWSQREKEDEVHFMISPILDLYDENDNDTMSEEQLLNIDISTICL